MNGITVLLYIVFAIIIGIAIGYIFRLKIAEGKKKNAELEAKRILKEVEEKAEQKKKEILIQAKDESYKIKKENERDLFEKNKLAQKRENRLIQREQELDNKTENLEKKMKAVTQKEYESTKLKEELQKQVEQGYQELQRVANLSQEQAKEILLKKVESLIQYDMATKIKTIEDQYRAESEKKGREIIATAIQRVASNQTTESTISVVPLPNDDIKGKIIGREGRNIRIFESLTGVDLLIDDTPEVVTLSSYDPVKREIGKIALEKLVLDGRIHPARIEELVQVATEEVEKAIIQEGEATILELGIRNMHPELVKLIGKLKYRSSYSQNVLAHSIEVAYISSTMAAELGDDIEKAKRAGLLHDIGKAIDKEIEGSHAKLGADILRKYGECIEVVNSAESHHGDVPYNSVVSCLVQAADAVSASRPGARREDMDAYVKRIQTLEKICNDFTGVEKAYAVQAGREIRIVVKPGEIDDVMLSKLSYDIVKRIEGELEYPGQIKVMVIRETRAVAYAK
ncbi:ribonuclease Y [bacterium]|nr:ribonuclease Y [bacterium]